MRVFIAAVILLGSIRTAEAHVGNENNTEIRVYADSMRMVLRTSIPLAWSLLGGNAPAMADEAGQAVAKPLLIAAAPALVTVTAGGIPMVPTQVDCQFEVQNDVAFILNFKRPAAWPVEVKMEFFQRLGNLETGTVAVFDYTASRFLRDVEPLAQKVLDRNNPSLSFNLAPPPVVAAAKQVAPPPQEPVGTRQIMVLLLLLAGTGGVGFLAYRRIKRR
jgi:hypothetical protein